MHICIHKSFMSLSHRLYKDMFEWFFCTQLWFQWKNSISFVTWWQYDFDQWQTPSARISNSSGAPGSDNMRGFNYIYTYEPFHLYSHIPRFAGQYISISLASSCGIDRFLIMRFWLTDRQDTSLSWFIASPFSASLIQLHLYIFEQK